MTSPAITKSPEKTDKSPTHSVAAVEAPAEPSPASVTAPPEPRDHFSWLRIFKLADLMMKQGC